MSENKHCECVEGPYFGAQPVGMKPYCQRCKLFVAAESAPAPEVSCKCGHSMASHSYDSGDGALKPWCDECPCKAYAPAPEAERMRQRVQQFRIEPGCVLSDANAKRGRWHHDKNNWCDNCVTDCARAEVVRALEEACKAVCHLCLNGYEVVKSSETLAETTVEYIHVHSKENFWEPCLASPIRSLMSVRG